jgi:hypothetical protein
MVRRVAAIATGMSMMKARTSSASVFPNVRPAG